MRSRLTPKHEPLQSQRSRRQSGRHTHSAASEDLVDLQNHSAASCARKAGRAGTECGPDLRCLGRSRRSDAPPTGAAGEAGDTRTAGDPDSSPRFQIARTTEQGVKVSLKQQDVPSMTKGALRRAETRSGGSLKSTNEGTSSPGCSKERQLRRARGSSSSCKTPAGLTEAFHARLTLRHEALGDGPSMNRGQKSPKEPLQQTGPAHTALKHLRESALDRKGHGMRSLASGRCVMMILILILTPSSSQIHCR